jgi:predicted Zn-dependent protease
VEQATQSAYRGDYSNLVDAERFLREARDLDGRDVNGPTLLLFVHAQRALEDGSFQAGYMRPAIVRGEAVGAHEAYLELARAVLALAENRTDEAGQRLDAGLTARPRDPAILYLAGRLEQRLGRDTAVERLQAAVDADAQLVAPRIALAEVRYDEGRAEDALELLGQVLAREAEHLRARLWRAFLTSDAEEPAAALAALDGLQETVQEHGAPTDRVLLELARSRLLRRQGTIDRAGEAVDRALLAGASEPRLLALVATEGRRAGRLLRAEQAARTALSGAPHNADFRKLLAGIELDRRNGRGALGTLASLDAADPDVVRMRAQAALLVGTEDALRAAVEALDAHVAAHAEAAIDVRALRIRIHARLGDVPELVAQARTLAQEAPGDPTVSLALGEAALRAFDGATAAEALAQAVLSAPEDAEVHYLLGRARRMTGDAAGAEQSLRRATELSAEHVEARLALGGLLLDTGRFADAETLYAELSRSARTAGGQAVTVAGRLGRVEALLGLGRLDDTQVQIEALPAEVRQAPTAQVLAARLALARGRPGEALGPLRPLATAGDASAPVVALYGDALLAAGQVEPAAEAYARAVTLDAALPEGLLGQAEMAVRSERGGDALPLLDQVERALAQRIRPPATRARLLLLRGRAQLLGGRDDLAAARESLRAAVELEGVSPEAHFYLGEALAGQNSPEARAAYPRYLELAPEGPLAARARRAVGR